MGIDTGPEVRLCTQIAKILTNDLFRDLGR